MAKERKSISSQASGIILCVFAAFGIYLALRIFLTDGRDIPKHIVDVNDGKVDLQTIT